MPDLVIKGMALPKTICGEPGYVDVRIFADGSVIMAKPAPPYYGKFEAVQLPKGHGKIIDGDALWENMTVEQSEAFQKGLAGTIELFEMLEGAHTIVPAEGGEADDSKL